MSPETIQIIENLEKFIFAVYIFSLILLKYSSRNIITGIAITLIYVIPFTCLVLAFIFGSISLFILGVGLFLLFILCTHFW